MNQPALPNSRLLRLSDALYGLLLHAYPRAFRQEFGAQMAQTLRADCRRAQAERGLHARLWGREGRLGGWGFVLVGLGLGLGLIGMGGSALGVLEPNPVARIINTGEHAGLVLIGAGMLLWGIVTLRERALGRWSILPLLMGLLSLTGIVFLIPVAFRALEKSIMPEVFGLAWMLLGFALLTSQANPSPLPTQTAAA